MVLTLFVFANGYKSDFAQSTALYMIKSTMSGNRYDDIREQSFSTDINNREDEMTAGRISLPSCR
jgi:hypothetical protein